MTNVARSSRNGVKSREARILAFFPSQRFKRLKRFDGYCSYMAPASDRRPMPNTPQTESRQTSAMKTIEVVAKLTEAQSVGKAQANSNLSRR
jgi:hypothetical protein